MKMRSDTISTSSVWIIVGLVGKVKVDLIDKGGIGSGGLVVVGLVDEGGSAPAKRLDGLAIFGKHVFCDFLLSNADGVEVDGFSDEAKGEASVGVETFGFHVGAPSGVEASAQCTGLPLCCAFEDDALAFRLICGKGDIPNSQLPLEVGWIARIGH